MMRHAIPVLCSTLLAWAGCAAPVEEPDPPKLLGPITAEQLGQEPFSEWFASGHDGYAPNADVLEALRRVDTDDVDVSIFFGTWCGDSRREVPRWIKLFEAMDFPDDRLALIAVDGTKEATKRSPGGEERGLEVYRVPTVIVRRGGTEIARFVEHPALSIERDLLAILQGESYQPSYASYPTIRRWLDEGLLDDANISPRGLADQVRHIVAGEGELASAAGVLRSRGDVDQAIKLLEVNCELYRESSRCHERLAEALLEAGDRERAHEAAERALQLNDDPGRVESLTDLVQRSGDEA